MSRQLWRKRSFRAGAVVMLAAALAVGGCSSSGGPSSGTTTPGASAPGGSAPASHAGSGNKSTLTIGVAYDPRSMWASSSTAQQEINISEQITEKLIEFTPDGSGFEPRLATKWVQKNPTTVELTLRQGVTFTDGEPFNADSAVASIAIMSAAPAYKSFTNSIDHAVKVDDHTIDVVSAKPTGLMLLALAMGSFQYPLEGYKKAGEDGFAKNPIGTGPYVLDHWSKGEEVALKANPHYWGGPPGLQNVVFKVIPDSSSQVAALRSGQIDLMYDVQLGSVDSLKGDKKVSVVTRPSNRIYYLTFSGLTDTPLKNPDVRKALQYAIDTKALIDNQLGGNATPLNGQILGPNYFGYNAKHSATPYDPAKAKELLAAAGYPHGFKITFKYPSGRYVQDKEVGQAVAAQLAQVGVQTDQQVLESGTFLTQLTSLKLNDMFFSGSLPPPDAHFMFQSFAAGAPYNYYADHAKIDGLIAQDATTADPDQRKEIINKIQDVFDDDPPVLPLYQGADIYATSAALTGFTPRASQFLDVRTIKFGG